MMFTKIDFGKMLSHELKNGIDLVSLSQWAYEVYLENNRHLELGLKDVLLDLGRMTDEPEFAYTHAELNNLASLLESGKG